MRDDSFDSAPPDRAVDDDVTTSPGSTMVDDTVDSIAPGESTDPSEGSAAPVAAAVPGLAERIARRAVRRPVAWWQAPWSNDRVLRLVITSASLVATTVVVMLVVNFNPLSPSRDLLFDDTTPTGGDMGAHVWAPAFLRDHFLPNFQLSGWSMDWYGGLPLYRFYMVIPALAIVLLDVVLPYGVAFKVIAASGLLFFPFSCWAFGRLAAFRHPIPELFAFGGLCFLLDESFEIYGGNVKSTMAGEYSFSIAMTLMMFGLGLLAHGLRTGRFRVWAAVLLALAAVSHGIVLMYTAAAALILVLVWLDAKRLVYGLTTGLTMILLSAWWVGPFLFGHEFTTDMKYGFRPNSSTDSFWDMFFPLTPALDILVTSLAVIGFLAMIVRRQLTGAALGLICIFFVVAVYPARDSLPVIGLLWNPRLLPIIYLTRYLLMMIGALEVITWAINAARGRLANAETNAAESAAATSAIGLVALAVFGFMYEVLPGGDMRTEGDAQVYAWGPLRKTPDAGRAVAKGWSSYNWTGYQGRSQYPEYHNVVSTMGSIGDTRGCGRALWENNSDNGQYGTTMALMLLPHWTDGCIGSMEGLFFEASGTTPYHFLTTAAMSESSSNPVRELRYTNNDAEVGVRHMRDLGVRYVMLRTDAAKAEAAARDELDFITTAPPWDIYEVTGSSIVEPLTVQPVVVNEREGDQRERNLELGTSWFQRRGDWAAVPADDGPADWQRIDVEIDLAVRVGEPDDIRRNVDYVLPVDQIDPVALPPVRIENLDIGQQSVEFSVDQIGVPVLVRVSYFPNWNVSGAEGPYRVAPNHMVVVPTSNDVRLSYGHSGLDWFFYGLTLVGIALCFVWRRVGDVQVRGDFPSWSPAPPPLVDRAGHGGLDHGATGAVSIVPDVWAPARPDDTDDEGDDETEAADAGGDATPLLIPAPLVEPSDPDPPEPADPAAAEPPAPSRAAGRSDIVIDTSPSIDRDPPRHVGWSDPRSDSQSEPWSDSRSDPD